MTEPLVLGVSDFVAVLNQTLEAVYQDVVIVGELANFRLSKNKWVYFDLKDDTASVKFFGSVYNLPGPLEDGLMLQVRGAPRLHPLFGFSVNIMSIQPVGEGSLKRAATLLEAKLRAEGLFDPTRKRPIAYPPKSIGLITSGESAAYADFIKIINARWGGIDICLADVQVQGESAPGQIVAAIQYFNQAASIPEVIVITRGGGSAEDLAAFNTEQVARAVAASRIPAMVAIGHEVDISLAELAADQRASTPSNAAELLVPNKRDERERNVKTAQTIKILLGRTITSSQLYLSQQADAMNKLVVQYLERQKQMLSANSNLLKALSPQSIMQRGYAVLRYQGKVIRGTKQIKTGDIFDAETANTYINAQALKVVIK